MSITKEQETQYVKEGGAKCPACGYDHIEGGDVTVDWGKAYQNVYCPECEEEWTDEYTLTGITEAE